MKHTLLFATALLAGAACAAIDANAAARAALTHAGLAAVASNALYVEPDLDDGRWVYEVKFHDGKTAYDYELDANTGAVLKAERKALRQIPNVAAAPAAQPAAGAVKGQSGHQDQIDLPRRNRRAVPAGLQHSVPVADQRPVRLEEPDFHPVP